MSQARRHAARAQVLGAALLGLCVGLAGGPVAAHPAGPGAALSRAIAGQRGSVAAVASGVAAASESRSPESRSSASRSPASRSPASRSPESRSPESRSPASRSSESRSPESRRGVGVGVGVGVAAAVSLGLGVGLLVQHREGYAQFEAAPDNAGFVAALGASSAGAGLVGAGLGLGVVGLTTVLSPGRGKGRWKGGADGPANATDRVLWAELAVGGGLALIGSAWYSREWQQVQRDLYDGKKDPEMDGTPNGHDPKAQRRETAASSIIGAGAGLMVGAGVALLTHTVVRLRARRQARSARWGLAGGPGQLGLAVRGRF